MVKVDGLQIIVDLKGKKIGYFVLGVEDVLVGVILKIVGLIMDDVQMVNVNWLLLFVLIVGQVDVIIGVYCNFELIQMWLEGV